MDNANAILILVDTNVWMDLFIPGRPGKVATTDFIKSAKSRRCELLFTLQSAMDVYAKVGLDSKAWVRKSGEVNESVAHAIRETAWSCVEKMRELATPVGADVTDLWLAMKLRSIHDDLEDDLILAGCQRAKVRYLVTRDKKLIRDANVAALTPEQMTALLAAEI